MKIFLILLRRKPKVVLTIFVFFILVYVLFFSHLTDSQSHEHVVSSYMLGPDGLSLYEQDGTERIIGHIRRFDQTCSERKNVVFIKGIKCATSTLLGVFYRFGYTRNLSFVTPVGNMIYLNWPFPLTFHDFRPSSHGYNILTDHSIYTENVMEAIMPKDTVYISIIREPFSQLKSIFEYFKLAKISGIVGNVENPIVEYLSHLETYESTYKTQGAVARWCIPDGFSVTKNIMAHCHGMPLGFPEGIKDISADNAAIEKYIQHLDSKFSLIMIVEYFFESLILLRRLMCWSFRDIVFIRANTADYSFKNVQVPSFILDRHRQWSNVDYRLYQYFNNTFWKRISQESSDFFSEVEAFKLVAEQVQKYCLKLYSTFQRDQYPINMMETVIEASAWNDKFSVTSKDCWMLGPDPDYMRSIIQKENDVKESLLLAEQQKIKDNRIVKGLC